MDKKVINPRGAMSNLIGMYAIYWNNEGELENTYYVSGKADNGVFILQQHNCWNGEFYKAILIKIEDLISNNWAFYSTKDECEHARDRHFKQLGKINF